MKDAVEDLEIEEEVAEDPDAPAEVLVPKRTVVSTEKKPKTYRTIAVAAPRVLVVFCGDPRFQGPVRQFLDNELGLKEGEYLPFVIRGGVASFTVMNFFSKEGKYVTEGAVNYIKQFGSIDKVILINHEDCGKYKLLQKSAPFFFEGVKDMRLRQRSDLLGVAQQLLALMPRHLEIEKYYASFSNSSKTEVVFEKQ
jgi:hypothetical protein